ncbi:MAG TPA: hypothetical protein VIJ64_12430 [Candidatus Lustribacter sp.]
MSPQTLTHRPLVRVTAFAAERLQQFAAAMARRDRSRHRHWLRDDDLERTFRGYAYAAAIAEHRAITLMGDDLEGAIATYRRVRRLPGRTEPSQRSLIALIDGRTAP